MSRYVLKDQLKAGEEAVAQAFNKAAEALSALQKKRGEDGKGRFDERRYADLLLKKMPPVRMVGSEWRRWEGGVWKQCERDEFRPAAQHICPPRYRTAANEKRLLDHIEGRLQVPKEVFYGAIRFCEKSGDVLLNCKNGVLRIGDAGKITLQKHSDADWFSRQIAAAWDENAEAKRYQEVLKQALPDVDDRALLQAFCGNVLWPDARFETALICYGEAGTSKSTIMEVIGAVMGDAVTTVPMRQICDSRSYSLPMLEYSSFNLATEVDTIAMDESTNFKLVVSGEPVMARSIYGKPFEMRTAAKLCFLANSLPRFDRGTEAELRRLRFIRFGVKPDKKDAKLKHALASELNGVFRWMVEGLVWLKQEQQIPDGGEQSSHVRRQFAISNDPVAYFVKTRCNVGVEFSCGKDELQGAYVEFLEEHGISGKVGDWFFRSLYERFDFIRVSRVWRGGERARLLSGISLKD